MIKSILFFYALLCITQSAEICSFSDDCQCDDNDDASCMNMVQFPTFSNAEIHDWNFLISGNFTLIPNLAFSNFMGSGDDLTIIRTGNVDTLLTIDPEAFVMTNLFTYISIENFHILSSVPNVPLAKALGLFRLTFIGSNFVTLLNASFYGLSIEQLMLSSNNVQDVDDNAFLGLENTLNTLFLNEKLNAIPIKSLQRLTKLGYLDLSSNLITEVPPNSFSTLRQLTSLNLNSNLISKISTNSFSELSILQSLYLRSNSIPEVSASSFSPLSQLQSLDLSSNMLVTMSANSFSTLSQLLSLNLSNNPLNDGSISSATFYNLTKLTTIYFDYCQLETVPTTALLPAAATLTQLSLNNNKITLIQSYAFQKLAVLKTLEIKNNPIATIQPYAFSGLATENLMLQGFNDLQSVSLNAFSGMPQVMTVGFQECTRLMDIEPTDASKLPSTLTTIKIISNPSLSIIDSSLQYWLKLSQSNVLHFGESNNFYCNSSVSWMNQFIFCSIPTILGTETSYCSNLLMDLKTYIRSLKIAC